MMMSPLRIFILYRQEGLVQTQALYSMEAPWLPKSESGTRSPSLHLRQRGNAFSTKSPPSFSLEDSIRLARLVSEKVSRGGASASASATPQQSSPCHCYHTIFSVLCQQADEKVLILLHLETPSWYCLLTLPLLVRPYLLCLILLDVR
jgi:hypothetical protein